MNEKLSPRFPLIAADRRVLDDRRGGDDRRSPALDLPLPKRRLVDLDLRDAVVKAHVAGQQLAAKQLDDAMGALHELHRVSLAMDLERDGKRPSELTYQRAMRKAARLIIAFYRKGTP